MPSPIDLPPADFVSDLSKETLQEMRAKSFERVCILKKQKEELEAEILRSSTTAEMADWFLTNRAAILDILGASALAEMPELFRSSIRPKSAAA